MATWRTGADGRGRIQPLGLYCSFRMKMISCVACFCLSCLPKVQVKHHFQRTLFFQEGRGVGFKNTLFILLCKVQGFFSQKMDCLSHSGVSPDEAHRADRGPGFSLVPGEPVLPGSGVQAPQPRGLESETW